MVSPILERLLLEANAAIPSLQVVSQSYALFGGACGLYGHGVYGLRNELIDLVLECQDCNLDEWCHASYTNAEDMPEGMSKSQLVAYHATGPGSLPFHLHPRSTIALLYELATPLGTGYH